MTAPFLARLIGKRAVMAVPDFSANRLDGSGRHAGLRSSGPRGIAWLNLKKPTLDICPPIWTP